MKRYLFRGFHPDEPYFTLVGKDTITLDGEVIHGEWVKGYLRNATTIDEYKEVEFDGVMVEVFVRSCRILPETVGQWVTTDKNGKDVFEGDIIGAFCNTQIFEVEYCKDRLGYFLDDVVHTCESEPMPECLGNMGDTIELIGNIFESEAEND